MSQTSEQWREWLEHPCSKLLMSSILRKHLDNQGNWWQIADERLLLRAQESNRITAELIGIVRSGSQLKLREICTGAGVSPDQLPD